MVCFRSCFTPFKSRKRRQYLSPVSSSPSKHPFISLANSPQYGHGGALESISEEPTNHVASESKEKKKKVEEKEEQLSCNVVKKVAFDGKVETQEEEQSLSAEQVGSVGKTEEQPNCCSNTEVEDGGLLVITDAGEGSCEDSEGGYGMVVEESSESLFSICISSRKYHADHTDEKEVTSPLPKCVSSDNSENVSALEEKTQLKEAVKETTTALQQYEDKENVKVDINVVSCSSPEFSFKPLIDDNAEKGANLKKLALQDVAVDASLSNWLLVGSGGDKTPQQENSVESDGYSTERQLDRPVLGALSIGVLKQVPANRISPSKSRSQRRIRGTTAITGTVGSYWMQTGRNTD